MRKLGTLLGALVLVMAAAYGGYWYQVKSKVDRMIREVAPFASVQYGTIYAHPDGTVGVNDLHVSPHNVHAPVRVEQVRARVGSPLALVFGGSEPPQELFVTFTRVQQNIESAFFHELQKQMDMAREADPLYVSPTVLGCGSIRELDVNAMRMMGYRDMLMDISVHFRGDDVTRKVFFEARVDIDDMSDSRMEMLFSADPSQLKTPMVATGNARLETLKIDYRDRGYNRRVAELCGREAELRPQDYRMHHLELFKRWLAVNAIDVPQGWLQAYWDLQQDGASLALELNPIGGFGASELMLMQDPQYIIEKLNPTARVNDVPLHLEGVKWAELLQQFAEAGGGGRVEREDEQESLPVVKQAPAAKLENGSEGMNPAVAHRSTRPAAKRFRTTPVEQLRPYIGSHVRIFTYFGNDVEGRLIAVDKQGVRVMQRMHQGMAEYPLEYGRIQQVEVYR